jgi:capsular polysaccharide biosynthesis protein
VPLNLALGFLLACFSSLGAAFAAEMNRVTFDSADELQASLNLPVLASVPVEGV